MNLLGSRYNILPVKEVTDNEGKSVKAYVPVGKKRHRIQLDDEEGDIDKGLERYLKLLDLLYGK